MYRITEATNNSATSELIKSSCLSLTTFELKIGAIISFPNLVTSYFSPPPSTYFGQTAGKHTLFTKNHSPPSPKDTPSPFSLLSLIQAAFNLLRLGFSHACTYSSSIFTTSEFLNAGSVHLGVHTVTNHKQSDRISN